MKNSLFVVFSVVVFAGAVPAYDSPNPQGLHVSVASISLPDSTRDNLATALAKCCGNVGPNKHDLVKRMVATALLVSPANPDAVVVDARLRKGESLKSYETLTPEKTAAGLTALGKSLQSGNRDDQRLAGYFFSIASDLDPENADAVYSCSMHERKHGAVDWSGLDEHPVRVSDSGASAEDDPNRLVIHAGQQVGPADHASTFKRNQAKVNGLVVRDIGATLSGAILEIVITVQPWHIPDVTRLEFATPAGNDMNVSLDEAVSLLRTRHPNLPGGTKMRVSFDDKYTPKDGGSAGLAFALVGFSLLDGLTLDPAVAVTGDVTVDWQVRAVGGIAAKIDGASQNDKSLVIIPAANASALEDMILLEGVEVLMRTQVFAVDKVTQAIEIVREDRTSRLQHAIDEFARLKTALDAKGAPETLLESRSVRTLVGEVASDVPEHASARYLAKVLSGWAPRELSMEGTLSEASALLWPYARVIKGYGHQEFDMIDDAILIESMIRANRLKEYSHAQVKALADTLYDLVYAHAEYRQSKKDSRTFRAELQKRRQEIGRSVLSLRGLSRPDEAQQPLLNVAYEKRTAVITELRKLSANHHFLKALTQ